MRVNQCLVVGLGLLVSLDLHGQATRTAKGPLLLVANQADHNLSLIDPTTNEQIAAVDVGGVTGHEVAASADGRTAFVPIYGNSGVGRPGTDGQSIAVIDLASRKIVHTIAFSHGVRPHLPVFDASGKTLYVTTELDQTITGFDPTSYQVVGTYPTGAAQSHMFVLSHDGKFAYTANVGPGSVSVIDLTARKVVRVIPVAKTVQRISMSRDGAKVFTSDQDEARLAVIDTASGAVKGWVPLPGVGYGTASTKDGRYLLVAMRTLKQVAVVDLQGMKVVRTIDMPGVPVEILVRPDGLDAYVSCGKGVAVVNTASFKVDAVIDAGNGADGLAWAQ